MIKVHSVEQRLTIFKRKFYGGNWTAIFEQ